MGGAGVESAPVLVVALHEGGGDGEGVLCFGKVVEESEERFVGGGFVVSTAGSEAGEEVEEMVGLGEGEVHRDVKLVITQR